jgi:hypothetical protein
VDDAAFLPEAGSAETLMGVSVQLPDHCACGSSIAVVAAGLHRAALHCATCQASRGWLPRPASDFISGIISRFGFLTAPVIIRRGERTSNNSGWSPNAYRQLAGDQGEKVMRKHEVFPSNYYNAKNVSTPIMRTIDYAVIEPVGEGTNQQQKLVAHFKEPDSKQDNEFWLEAWNGNSYLVERMSRPPITVEHLLVGVVGGLQPDKLSRSFVGDQDGMYARICFSWPSEPPYRPLSDDVAEIEPEVVNAFSRLIKLPCEGDAFGKMAPLSAAARAKFEQLRQFLHAERDALDGREREWWSKVQAHVLRLAGTLCFLDWAIKDDGSPEPQYVDEVFVSAAARLACEYFWPHSRAALRQIGLSERHANARRTLRWIKATKRTEVSIRDIGRDAMAGSLDAEATLDLVERLVSSGWLVAAPVKPRGPKGGKPVHRRRVNLLLWTAQTAETAETKPTAAMGL